MSHHTFVVIYDAMFFLAVLLILCTLLPAIFSRNVQRTMGWYSLMAAWLVYSVNYVLLIGWQERQEGPPFGLCLVQILLIYPGPALATSSTLCYYLEFYFKISSLKSGNLRPQSAVRTLWLAVTPWLIFLAMFIEVLVFIFAGGNLSRVEFAPNGFFCHVGSFAQGVLMAVVAACAVLVLVPLEAWTGFSMYRHWTSFKRLGQNDRRLFLTVYIRFLLVTISALIALGVSLQAFAVPNDTGNIGIAYPFIPICIALAFGTQRDILQVWLFWRPSEPHNTLVFHNQSLAVDIAFSNDLNAVIVLSRLEEEQSESQCPTIVSPDSPTMSMDIRTPTLEGKTTKEHIELTTTDIKLAVNV